MQTEDFEKKKKLIYEFLCDPHYVPMRAREMAVVLNLTGEKKEELHRILDALVAEGKILLSPRGKYRRGDAILYTGVFYAHAKGFGFVTVDGQQEDFFVSPEHKNGAFHEDTVQIVQVPSNGKRREAKVVQVLERGCRTVVGTYEKRNSNYGFVRPDNPRFPEDIFVPQERSKGAEDGHKVVVELTSYGGTGRKPEGKITEILGHMDDPGVDIVSIVRAYSLPVEFPEKVYRQAERVAKEVSEADRKGRLDLRHWMTVTIDGEDAKDLDDAVTISRQDGVYELGVHIADVSNYVQERSALDQEAIKRGTSVYLVDRVIPMLPQALSNGICSLNEGQDRLTLSCIMTVDEKGNIIDHRIVESVIRVDRRMSYTDVDRIITKKDPETTARYQDFAEMFFLMKELADLLRARRRSRGSIDFDFPETKIELDPDGRPVDIRPYDRNPATRIIEDFMLAANETVAQDYFWQSLPFLYRVHEKPDTEKIKKLSTFINNFGYHIHIGSDEVHPMELQKLLGRIEGSPEETLISRLTLRSMKRARYDVTCSGHFGLAAPYYCHFTSPIRRYPDLQIHRIIKDNLRGRMDEERIEHYESILPEAAFSSSRLERRAEEAERETEKLKKAEYMEKHIGEIFEGVISGITKYGIYVELPNTVEGMVPVAALPGDYFNYDEDRYEMVGDVTGIRYRLGQRVRVQVRSVNRMLRTIDFMLVEEDTQ